MSSLTPSESASTDGSPAFLRGRTSPALALPEAVEGLRQVHAKLSQGPYSRDLIAKALGHEPGSGTANTKVGALTHYGLLDRSGSSYSVSLIGTKILMPENDPELTVALTEAAKSPGLYTDLLETFAGKALPHLLANILVRNYGVLPRSSEKVAQTFRTTMEYAGLLRNGILYTTADLGAAGASTRDEPTQGPVESRVTAETPSRGLTTSGETQRYTIPLAKDGRLAVIDLPVPVASSDLNKVRAWVTYMMEVTADDETDSTTEIA